MRRLLTGVLAWLVLATPLVADDLFVRLEQDPGAVLARLREQEADPGDVLATLRRGPVDRPAVDGNDLEIEIVGGDGRRSIARILVPDDYRPGRPAPLLIGLHGKGGSEDQLIPALRRAAASGWLVACPRARPHEEVRELGVALLSRLTGSAWWAYGADNLVLATLAEMRRRFDVDDDRVVLSGYSMGGYGTWNVGLRFHPRFAGLAPLAGGISLVEHSRLPDLKSRRLLANARNLPIFMMHGDADRLVPVAGDRRTHEELVRLGYDHVYHQIAGGGHRLGFLRGRGDEYEAFWTWLDDRRRPASPAETVHVALENDHPTGDWIEILRGKTGTVRVDGRIVDGNRIEIETSRVERLRVFLFAERLDLGRPVTIVVDGRVAFEGVVEPSCEAVVASWRAYGGDRSRLTAHAVVVGR